MRPDFLFILAGSAAVLAMLGVAFYALRNKRSDQWWAVLCWALLACGFLLQGFSPHLQINQNAFVMQASSGSGGRPLDPIELVQRERLMQGIAGILSVIACAGLAFHYRQYFMKPSAPSQDTQSLR